MRAETEEGERQRKSQSSGEGDRASDGRGTSAGGTSAARIISADETDASPWDADAAPPELRETLALLKRMGKLALSALEGALQLPRGRLTAAVEGGEHLPRDGGGDETDDGECDVKDLVERRRVRGAEERGRLRLLELAVRVRGRVLDARRDHGAPLVFARQALEREEAARRRRAG